MNAEKLRSPRLTPEISLKKHVKNREDIAVHATSMV